MIRHKHLLYKEFDKKDIDTQPDGHDFKIRVKGRLYTVYMTLSSRIPDDECMKVRIKGTWYYFG